MHRASPCILALLTAAGLIACGSKSSSKEGPAKSAAPDDAAVAAAVADAAPENRQRKQLSKEQLAAYAEALRRGQKLEKKGKYGKAVAAFERALAIKPGDARASSELGWVRFRLGDLDGSIEASRASAAAASDRRLKAASLYNLGRALEGRKDRDGAIAAYRESFDQRPNQVVFEKLVALGAAQPGDLVAPRPMPGPYASVAAYCKEWLARHAPPSDHAPGYNGWECGTDNRPYDDEYERVVAPPFEDLVVFSQEVDWAWTYRIAMKTAAGWYIGPQLWTREANTDYGSLERVSVGDGGMLSMRWDFESNARDHEAEESPYYRDYYLVVCGADLEGRVSCTPTLDIGYHQGGDDTEETYWSVEAVVRAGTLSLSKSSGDLPAEVAAVLGEHTIEFH